MSESKLFSMTFETLIQVLVLELTIDKLGLITFTKGILIGNLVGLVIGYIVIKCYIKKGGN